MRNRLRPIIEIGLMRTKDVRVGDIVRTQATEGSWKKVERVLTGWTPKERLGQEDVAIVESLAPDQVVLGFDVVAHATREWDLVEIQLVHVHRPPYILDVDLPDYDYDEGDDEGDDAPDCTRCHTSNTGSREFPHLCESCQSEFDPEALKRIMADGQTVDSTSGRGHDG